MEIGREKRDETIFYSWAQLAPLKLKSSPGGLKIFAITCFKSNSECIYLAKTI